MKSIISMNPRLLTTLIFWTGLIVSLWRGSTAALVGLVLLTLGGMRLAQEKGHSRWLGMLGMLGGLGAVILLLLPRSANAMPESPESPASRRLKRSALLLTMAFAVVLVRDSMLGRDQRWLPEVFPSQMILGPPLFVIAVIAYLRQLRQAPAENPRLAQVASGLLWVARGLGILLILAPFLVMLDVSVNRAPGVRPGNEGEGLGLFIVFMLCLPTGLALTLASFWPRPKQSPVPPAPVAKPDDGGRE